MNNYHISVLVREVLDFLQVETGRKYIDATLGGGGHSKKILEKGGQVLGIDVDEDALDFVRANQEARVKNQELTLAKGNFKDLAKIARLNKFEKVAGVLFDLGVSSHQVDTPQRGFSFLRDGPLDMRMDKDSSITAEALVNVLEKGELYDIFNRLGEEHRAFAISNSITRARRVKAIQTTAELARAVEKAYGIRKENISDFAKSAVNKKVFQALRMAVNGELENLTLALPQALEVLESKGRIVVISFHSLEDGIVKNLFKEFAKQNMGRIITNKPLSAKEEEAVVNSRSKSAKLRVFEKN